MSSSEVMRKYEFPTKGISKRKAVFCGEKYRITVLTPSLLRLEYSENGEFEDRATQTVINRDFAIPACEVKLHMQDGIEWIDIETEEIKLCYDQKKFSKSGLEIQVKKQGCSWHYGEAINDLKGTYRTLDRVDGEFFINLDGQREKIKLGTGVISREGFSVIDDSKSMALTEEGWVEPRKGDIDLYFFGYGHRYLQALNDFYCLCGRTPLLPRFALGNWWSRFYEYTEAEYKDMILRFEQEKLPFSVAVIDMDWHLVDDVDPKYGGNRGGWTGYTWNRKLFPDPEGFMAWLHNKNMKVTLNVHPADGIRAFEEIYPKMAEAVGIDPATEQAVEFDPTNSLFMEKYFEVVCHDLENQGVDFWWIDWQQGEESKIPGLDPLWMLNHFHYLDNAWKGSRPMTFSRYAEVGSHRYPVGFSGDTAITWESLDYQPYFTSTASNIGYGWWSHDIGGHMWGSRDDELSARWVQYGVFSPINRLHSSKNPFSGKEPWRYAVDAREVMNRYLRLRHSMIPYLYTMNRRASRENLPLVQPMYYADPECEEAYQVPNEYYFGTELVVSPVTTPMNRVSKAAKVQTWLPEGIWTDMFNGRIYKGARMIDMWRPLDNIPVLMKAGAIVPMKNMEDYDNSVDNPVAMEVRIFPAEDGIFTLWEDAGDTLKDRDENWASTELKWNCLDAAFIIGSAMGNIEVIPSQRSWKLVFCGVEDISADSIVSQGRNCNRVSVTESGIPLKTQVSYEEENSQLIIQIPEVDITKEIVVSFASRLIMANNADKQCFKILQRAQMDYDLKEKIWNIICSEGIDVKAELSAIDMDESVRSCLFEVI